MAGLTSGVPTRWTSQQSRAQFAALAQLRWHLFRNALRRKGGAGELIARILLLPIFGVFALGPVVGAGFAAFYILSSHQLQLLPALTWSIFALWLLVSINISPPGLSFDIDSILRFPISFPRYLATRLFFGLLSASTVIGTLALVSADIGIGVAQPALLPWSTLVLAVFAAANIFFTRMVFAWVDRWLSTRRAREVLTGIILLASVGLQYLNLTFNPGLQHGRHRASPLPLLLKISHRVRPAAALLPPGLTADCISRLSESRFVAAAASLCGLIAFAALFLAIFARRMQREFRGENLAELAVEKRTPAVASGYAIASQPKAHIPGRNAFVPPALAACLRKELLYLRRTTSQLYNSLVPTLMVLLFAGRIGANERIGQFVFPLAVAYSVLGVAMLSYNSLGAEGPGVQFYLLSPARLRDVFLAKNLIHFVLNLIVLALVFAVIVLLGHPPSLQITLATLCWLAFVTFTHTAIGNLRSLIAPKAIDLTAISRRQVSQLSAIIVMAVTAACLGIGCAVVLSTDALNRPSLQLPALLLLAAGAFFFYLQVLNRLDNVALHRRETLLSELCKP